AARREPGRGRDPGGRPAGGEGHHRLRRGGHPGGDLGLQRLLPGATLRAERGERVRINVTNEVGETTTTHWHGHHLPAPMDEGRTSRSNRVRPGARSGRWTSRRRPPGTTRTCTAPPPSTCTAAWPGCSSWTTRRAGSWTCPRSTGWTTSR